jgi:hypothetical protein
VHVQAPVEKLNWTPTAALYERAEKWRILASRRRREQLQPPWVPEMEPMVEEEDAASDRARFFFGGSCLIRAITGVDYS